MTITANELELEIIQIELPTAHRTTLRRRALRLQRLAMDALAYGPRGTTEHSAMVAAQRCYLAELGRWVKICQTCGKAFAPKRSDAERCGSTCRRTESRRRRRNG